MQMFGRTVIYTDVTSVTAANVREVLSKAMAVHMQNQAEIDYLYDIGKVPPKPYRNCRCYLVPA